MELMELLTKAIAPQVLARIFDTMPQFVIIASFAGLFMYKQLMKWNKTRVEKVKAKEERSNEIWEDVKSTKEGIKLIIEEHKEIRAEHKQDRIDTHKQFKEIVENFDKKFESTNSKINNLDIRVAVIETKDEINSKQENAIITMLNRIFNSIEKK